MSSLFAAAGVEPVGGQTIPASQITCLTDDSREVVPGGCFVAIRGGGRDGHEYIDKAAEAGAAVIVAQSDVTAAPGVHVIRVTDTRIALARLAAAYFGLRDGTIRLAGVTGTNGKTTVAWLLRSIFKADGRPTALLGTIEYDLLTERWQADMTTPGPLELCRRLAQAREAGAADAVLEVSSHALDQHRCDGLTFTAGVFTNLTGDHLDYHKTMEAYGTAKKRLFEALPSESFAILNEDDPASAIMASGTRARVLRYAFKSPKADVTARNPRMGPRGTALTLATPIGESNVETCLLGKHNVSNVLAASATALAMGIPLAVIGEGIRSLSGVPGRLQRVEPEGCTFSVLVDYAHTDDALRNVLAALRPLAQGRLICVFGCGGDRDRSKRPRMAAAVNQGADLAIVTSDNPRTEDPLAIIDEILPGFRRGGGCQVEVEPDRRQAIVKAIQLAQPGDAVLIAGKGHENYQLIGGKVHSFDDALVARECLLSHAVAGGVP